MKFNRLAVMAGTTASALLLTFAVAVALPPAASANSDPHRGPVANQPFDLPTGFCAFPVHVTFSMDKEYATVSALPDGSTVLKVTGALFITATNTETDKAITVNASGPGTFTVAPDGSSYTAEVRGMGFTYGLNLASFGAPSNVILAAGPNVATFDTATSMFTYMKNPPHVLLDVCAAIS
jgi:hypothetical protein